MISVFDAVIICLEEIRQKAERVVRNLQEKHGGDYVWQGDKCVDYKYPAVNARVTFDNESLTVKVELGLFMKALKTMLEEEITRSLDKHLA
ncbi:MAG: polyhydroxyalkanoic acid system family protein [Porticoccaceae bacterium]